MSFNPDLAEIRFGCGLSPVLAPPMSAQEVLNGVSVPDQMATRFPIRPFTEQLKVQFALKQTRDQLRATKNTPESKETIRNALRAIERAGFVAAGQTVMRWTWTPTGFRERLAFFWADHFTAVGKNKPMRAGITNHVEEFIRPHIGGTFAEMLIAMTTSPAMLAYLDQNQSQGPASRKAQSSKNPNRGLNENLAREVLELHTLGVDGPYTQEDVRQLAELFTGLAFNLREGVRFRPNWAEPGSETVLGRTYGGGKPTIEPIWRVLVDLAHHPATARHIARKLAVHFVSDTPDPGLVSHIEARFLETGGQLLQVYAALLEHPASWAGAPSNVKPPFDFMLSATRALAMPPENLGRKPFRKIRGQFLLPAALMGQPWQRASGPDGWPEEDSVWITPQGVSARVRWAMASPTRLVRDLPDPRVFAEQSLGRYLPASVRFAAEAAESRSEAIGLVLASPAFQYR